jgi:excinuclease ABC subunit A
MGPEGGEGGGTVVAGGTPEQVAEVAVSHTGRYLKKVLAQHGYLDVPALPEPAAPAGEGAASSNGKKRAGRSRKTAAAAG